MSKNRYNINIMVEVDCSGEWDYGKDRNYREEQGDGEKRDYGEEQGYGEEGLK